MQLASERLSAALRRDTAASSPEVEIASCGEARHPPLPPTRSRRLASGGGVEGGITASSYAALEVGNGVGGPSSSRANALGERVRATVLWAALGASALAVIFIAGATLQIARRSFASPFSAHDEYRMRHFTTDAVGARIQTQAAASSSDADTQGRGGSGGGGTGHREAGGLDASHAMAQRRWMTALHGTAVRAGEELAALSAFHGKHGKLPQHPDDGTPRAVQPGESCRQRRRRREGRRAECHLSPCMPTMLIQLSLSLSHAVDKTSLEA